MSNYCQADCCTTRNNRDIPGHYLCTGAGIFLLSLALYVFTLAPTVIWGDSAKFALNVHHLSLHYTAEAHPLYIILGKVFALLPFEPAYSLNLMTALTASTAVFLVYLVVVEITGSRISALGGALALSVSHAFWSHAVIAEVYDFNAAFLAALILLVLKWSRERDNYRPLYLAAFLFGLGLTNHRVLALDLVGLMLFVFATDPAMIRKAKKIFAMTASAAAGSIMLIYLMAYDMLTRPSVQVADKFTAEGYKKVLVEYSPEVFKEVGLYVSYLFYQFPAAGFVLGLAGIAAISGKDRRTALLLVLLLVVNALFFIKFGPGYGSTKYTFYISAYMVFSILIGCGLHSVGSVLEKKGLRSKQYVLTLVFLLMVLPAVLYNIIPCVTSALDIDLLHARTIPYRDNDRFFLNPSKRGYYGAEKYAMEVFETAESDAVVFADFTPYTVLKYYQDVKGMRKDLTILMPGSSERMQDGTIRLYSIKGIVSQYYDEKSLYLADLENPAYYNLKPIKDAYEVVPHGILYKIVRKEIRKTQEG